MKPSVLHIVLSLALLLSYGAERLLPCSGIWDIDCSDARTEQSDAAVHAHDGPAHSENSESSDDHGNHQCGCPCHAVAITSSAITVHAAMIRNGRYVALPCSLPHTALSPPDHIPIA